MPKGKSHSRRPVGKRAPMWCRYSPEEVEALVIKLAREENPPSKIGLILRDQYGIPLVKTIVRKSISEIISESDLKIVIPEDLSNLVNKANGIARHLSHNKTDSLNVRSLEMVVSRIRRLAKYYKRKQAIPESWEYKPNILTA